ncbi:ubiquitin-conjugating enzyme/RWD-like protein [Paraphysoderma sedebokerense]|nr:ubiquitin-conjugating enzyme/RWD-like protein [Paraphysoderma sedebokerense]
MSYNPKNSAVRRILKELQDFQNDPSDRYHITALEDNIFEIHFTVRGPPSTPYEKGRYHGRLLLPPEYPFKPPSIFFSTPNGRFEINRKICLSVSDHHPESWQPAWGLRTVLVALSGFMAQESTGAIGSLEWTAEEREVLADRSSSWMCPTCKLSNLEILPNENISESKSEKEEPKLNFTFEGQKRETQSTTASDNPGAHEVSTVASSQEDQSDYNPIAAQISEPENSASSSSSSANSNVHASAPASTPAAVAPVRPPINRQNTPVQPTQNRANTSRIDVIIISLVVLIVSLLAKKYAH